MSRSISRKLAMQFLFQIEFQLEIIDEQIAHFVDSVGESEMVDRTYFDSIIKGVIDKKDELDKLIEKNTNGWTIDRISKTDLAILRVAIYEMFYREDIPVGVAINEAVEITKEFSPQESPSFVNGILGKLSRGMDNE